MKTVILTKVKIMVIFCGWLDWVGSMGGLLVFVWFPISVFEFYHK